MGTAGLLKRNLRYYWHTNLAVLMGVAAAVAVLAGALLVGNSVRSSLRDLFLQRLGKTDYVISAPTFFRDQLASDLQGNSRFLAAGLDATCPMIVLRGSALHEGSRRHGGQVNVYGVDARFWHFQNQQMAALPYREVLVSAGLADELRSKAGDSLLITIEKPSDIPVESLHGRKEDHGRTLRLTVRGILSGSELGEFSLFPEQGSVRAVFMPLALLQKELDQPANVNTILVSEKSDQEAAFQQPVKLGALQRTLEQAASLEDFGIELRNLDSRTGISIETESRVLGDSLTDAIIKQANHLSLRPTRVLSYLANSISSNDRAIPYSLVTALDKASFVELTGGKEVPVSGAAEAPIILNKWAAEDLAAHPGDLITLEYYVWHEDGRLETKRASFRLAAIVPITGMAADKNLVPRYPGITETLHLSDWDPPFPIDLSRVRKKDEDYWDQYRTTPKAFVQLERGQELWQSRFGKLTSIRVLSTNGEPVDQLRNRFGEALRANLTPAAMGFSVIPVRTEGLQASRGATDFGEYFLYFSFFLVVAALLLAALFFKLGIEQRMREIGTLEAIGFPPGKIRNLFLIEGFVLSVLGSLLGVAGAIAYGYLLMWGLKTWWVEAVGTTMLRLHVSWIALLLGALGGIVASVVCVAVTLRRMAGASARSLLMGASPTERLNLSSERSTFFRLFTVSRLAFVFALLGILFLIAASAKQIGQVAGFFGGGTLLLIALLCYQSAWLRQSRRGQIHGTGWLPVSRLGFRNATYRPGRSILCIALIASAAFIIVAVDAFRRDNTNETNERRSGTGGFSLLAQSLVPLVHNPNTEEGREALNLTGTNGAPHLEDVAFTRFRVRAGDDASCLNLYQPHSPKIIAPTDDFLRSARFTFQDSMARTAEEKANPWLLLNAASQDDAIPVIADANSLTYVLHLKLGDELILNQSTSPLRLRVVGALADSIFQSELLMSERNFLRLFPEEQGYKFFLIETPNSGAADIGAILEDRLSDYGFDVKETSSRLAEFHRVENTYLSTFQLLGGLGLVLGTLGMAAVLFRNVLERRRELALLRAVGYNSLHFTLMVIAENCFLLFCGLATGTICALLAVAPVFFGRGGRLPNVSLGLLLFLVLLSGLIASLVATVAALRSPLIPALKAE